MEPFGKGNTKPIFAQEGTSGFKQVKILGKNRNVAKATAIYGSRWNRMEAICFEDFVLQQEEICRYGVIKK